MKIRQATANDAGAMSEMLRDLVAAGKRTAAAAAIAYVLDTYIGDPDRIACSLAHDADGALLGFQSLKRATGENRFGTPAGWGIIGTHVSPTAARRGVGTALFEVTKAAAIDGGIERIEAFIGDGNAEGLAYYEKIGFSTHRRAEGAICKVYDLAGR